MEEPSIQLRSRGQVDQVSRQLSELQESLAGAEARRETVIKAPVSGTVTNIAVVQGQSVPADTPLATVLPKGSGLHVELLVPSRAIGFIQKGQQVVLRYEAFPHERFGQYRGTVLEISRNVWAPGDKIGPLTVREPVYRVDVKLERQSVAALGAEIARLRAAGLRVVRELPGQPGGAREAGCAEQLVFEGGRWQRRSA